MASWSSRVATAQAYARAGGRRRVNAARKAQAWERRKLVLAQLRSGFRFGGLAALARELGVSKAAISRDIKALLRVEPLLASAQRNRTRKWRRRH